jgi:hypothetical protein
MVHYIVECHLTLYFPSHVGRAANNYIYTEGGGDPGASAGWYLVSRLERPQVI